MWKYKRVNTLLNREWSLFFKCFALLISTQGFILSEVNKELEEKMKQSPHLFQWLGDAKAVEKVEKVEVQEQKEEIVVKRRRGRKPKSKKEE